MKACVKLFLSLFVCTILFMLISTSRITYGASASAISDDRCGTIGELEALKALIEGEKKNFSGKNAAERIFVGYISQLDETLSFILDEAVPSAYNRGYAGEQIGNLKEIQSSLEDLMASNRQNISDYRSNEILSKFPYTFYAKKIKSSANNIIRTIDKLDITDLLYDLYEEGWKTGKEDVELPDLLTYEELIKNNKTIINDISKCIFSKQLAECFIENVSNNYDANETTYISRDGKRHRYSITAPGYADTDYIFYTHKYYANGEICRRNYYSAVQCAGLASYTYSKLFKADYANRDGLSTELMSEFKMSDLEKDETLYDYFVANNISSGAHVRTKDINGKSGHSIIILAYTKEAVLFYEGNYDGYYSVRYACVDWETLSRYLFKDGKRKVSYVCMPKKYDAIVRGIY